MRQQRAVCSALIVCLAASGCHRSGAPEAPVTDIAIDHVIVGIDSLERGMLLLEKLTGVRPRIGGSHPGRGTRNALLGLGSGRYLELIAPNSADTSAAARESAAERTTYFSRLHGLTPIGWAVRVSDIDGEAQRLRARGLPSSAPQAGSRMRGSGSVLRWQTVDPWGEDRDVLPFVIAWSSTGPHPSTDSPVGCTIDELTIASPQADSLQRRLAQAGWRLSVVAAAREELRLTLDCPRGQVRLPERSRDGIAR